MATDAHLTFACPRCGGAAEEAFYGPCGSCRSVLRAEQRGEQRAVETMAFEPAMHVTPNAVALKDD